MSDQNWDSGRPRCMKRSVTNRACTHDAGHDGPCWFDVVMPAETPQAIDAACVLCCKNSAHLYGVCHACVTSAAEGTQEPGQGVQPTDRT
jgi:hypothetical protein